MKLWNFRSKEIAISPISNLKFVSTSLCKSTRYSDGSPYIHSRILKCSLSPRKHRNFCMCSLRNCSHPLIGVQWVKPIASKQYRILSKNLSPKVSREICHLVAVRIGISKIAWGDKYLDYRGKTLERIAKL